MRKKYYLLTALLLINVVSLPSRANQDWPDTGTSGMRLHLADQDQEGATSSLNWWDLRKLRTGDNESVPLRILIDPGHGGRDNGTHSVNGVFEKWVSLQIANQLKRELERQKKLLGIPFMVKLTREDDTYLSLRDRVKIANEWGAELFISIHGNSSPVERARGFEVYFMNAEPSDRTARELAKLENSDTATDAVSSPVRSMLSDLQATQHVSESSLLAEEIFHALSLKVRPNIHGIRQGPFAVLAGTLMPAILVEVGYLTHHDEGSLLGKPTYQKKVATSISHGILSFLQSKRKPSYRRASR